MMYSDYFALSSCAISVTFIPFMVVCQLRYALILQAFNYSSAAFLRWLRCAFLAAAAPLLAICVLAFLCEGVFFAFLTHTAGTEMQILVGYALLMILACGCIAAGFGRFCRVLGGAGWTVPRIDDSRLRILFLLSTLVIAALMLLLNLFALQEIIYFMPLSTPFFVPLLNQILRPWAGGSREETPSPVPPETVSSETEETKIWHP